MGNLIQRLVPEARIVIGHGQMGEHTLEKAMLDFMAHKADVLLSTTIIENGIDIPNANSIIINRADRYGLVSALSAAGPSGAQRSAGIRLSVDSARRGAVAGRAQAACRDPGVQRPRQRVPYRRPGSRNSRRWQPARRRAERTNRRRRLRDVHEAAGGNSIC